MDDIELQTVAETSIFARRAAALLTPEEKDEVIYFLARYPEAGVEIPDTGGVRKVRWAAQDKGKSGGVRVVYFFYNATFPLYALLMYGKGEQEDLSPEQRKAVKKLCTELKAAAKAQKKKRSEKK